MELTACLNFLDTVQHVKGWNEKHKYYKESCSSLPSTHTSIRKPQFISDIKHNIDPFVQIDKTLVQQQWHYVSLIKIYLN